ncbi:hypothetical protein CN469_04405 [Bacillus cereus]|nr:hypothetical protein CN469_04405 [Bacillus cereus]
MLKQSNKNYRKIILLMEHFASVIISIRNYQYYQQLRDHTSSRGSVMTISWLDKEIYAINSFSVFTFNCIESYSSYNKLQ